MEVLTKVFPLLHPSSSTIFELKEKKTKENDVNPNLVNNPPEN